MYVRIEIREGKRTVLEIGQHLDVVPGVGHIVMAESSRGMMSGTVQEVRWRFPGGSGPFVVVEAEFDSCEPRGEG